MNTINCFELFAGCGGLGYGFHKEGFNIIACNELESQIADTYKENFPNTNVIVGDITKNDIKEQNLNLSIWLKPHKNIMTLFFNTSLSNINNDSKNIEHIDIDNIPINKLFFMAINVNDNIIEIYINGQLSQVNTLDKNHMLSHNYENKIHIFNNNDSFFESYMYNLSYLPYFATYKEIKKIYSNKLPKSIR